MLKYTNRVLVVILDLGLTIPSTVNLIVEVHAQTAELNPLLIVSCADFALQDIDDRVVTAAQLLAAVLVS